MTDQPQPSAEELADLCVEEIMAEYFNDGREFMSADDLKKSYLSGLAQGRRECGVLADLLNEAAEYLECDGPTDFTESIRQTLEKINGNR